MSSYLVQDQLLFSCDFFSSHLASSDLFVRDSSKVYEEAKRYYAEIMMPFRNQINKNLSKLEQLEIRYIAPSHGPIYDEPKFIIDAYQDWNSDKTRNMVIIPYISMHGSIEKMVHHLVSRLIEKGITVRPFNLVETDIGKLAIALVDATTIVFGTPTVLSGVHPLIGYASMLINMLKPKTRFVSIINSQEWGGHAIDIVKNSLNKLKAEYIDPVLIKGLPKEQAYKLLDQLAEEIYNRHQALELK
jgi:flavorubredoxin